MDVRSIQEKKKVLLWDAGLNQAMTQFQTLHNDSLERFHFLWLFFRHVSVTIKKKKNPKERRSTDLDLLEKVLNQVTFKMTGRPFR